MAGYGSDVEFLAWLSSQGLSLPVGSPTSEVLRQLGSDYVDAAYEWRLQCSSRTGGFSQDRAWPRSGHKITRAPVPDDMVPAAWIKASYRAAYLSAVTPNWSLTGSDPGRITQREKVDVIERTFFAPGEATERRDVAPGMPFDSYINGLVAPWLCKDSRDPRSLFMVI